jgi:hypothetical protein
VGSNLSRVKSRIIITPSPSVWHLELRITGLLDMTLKTEVPCHGWCCHVEKKSQNLQPFNGNGDVSISVKVSAGGKTITVYTQLIIIWNLASTRHKHNERRNSISWPVQGTNTTKGEIRLKSTEIRLNLTKE